MRNTVKVQLFCKGTDTSVKRQIQGGTKINTQRYYSGRHMQPAVNLTKYLKDLAEIRSNTPFFKKFTVNVTTLEQY